MSNQIELDMNKTTDASLEGTVNSDPPKGKKQGKLTLATGAALRVAAGTTTPTAAATSPTGVNPVALPVEPRPTPGSDSFKALDYMPDVLLTQILSTKRAHGSEGDMKFRLWLFAHLKSIGAKPEVQVEGNILVETDPKSTILFSCHVDTVHSVKESDGKSVQTLSFDPAFGHLFLGDKKENSCLGGDDGVGIWIMINMIKNNIPGRYMFHTGEERGGIGSRAFLSKNKAFLNEIEAVIAFDRAVQDGKNPEVICTQGGQRCASDVFGDALAKALNEAQPDFDFPYVVGHGGSFTDSKVYAMDVPECVNLGCFYARQHTAQEYVDCYGLDKLMAAVLKVDWKMLPIDRNPAKQPTVQQNYKSHGYSAYDFADQAQRELDEYYGQSRKPDYKYSAPKPSLPQKSLFKAYEFLEDYTYDDLVELAETDSSRAAFAIAGLLAKVRGLETQVEMLEKMMDV
jgi:hypothetical protein